MALSNTICKFTQLSCRKKGKGLKLRLCSALSIYMHCKYKKKPKIHFKDDTPNTLKHCTDIISINYAWRFGMLKQLEKFSVVSS